jgi:methionyl-tRNA formyltransferase
LRLIFFGTPDFAVPSLRALVRRHDVALVVAQPDRPAGRGMKLHKPPVAAEGAALGIEVIQPAKIRNEEFFERIRAVNADAAIVIAYGRILPAALLAIPTRGFINVHGSILPKYRGAAPIQRAIEAGETLTGVTIMRVDEDLDHGPILHTEEMSIGEDERLPSVWTRMAELGAGALIRALDGPLIETPQDHSSATYAPKVEKHEGRIKFGDEARRIYDRFRAFDPWPGAFFEANGEIIKVGDMRRAANRGEPGTIVRVSSEGVTVVASEGSLIFISLQRPNKAKANAADVARALGLREGDRLS